MNVVHIVTIRNVLAAEVSSCSSVNEIEQNIQNVNAKSAIAIWMDLHSQSRFTQFCKSMSANRSSFVI